MAFSSDQNVSKLPAGPTDERPSTDFLPRYFRTSTNQKFISATIDQMISKGGIDKINAFIGRKTATAYQVTDNYLEDVNSERENYQLEPALVLKDDLDNVKFFSDYNDYINQLHFFNSASTDHNKINSQEYYAWDPHIDWDKFVNYREYYWLPSGPPPLGVSGQAEEIISTYTVNVVNDGDNNAYVFTPDGLTRNPSLRLYRGQTYKFEINAPGSPIAFSTTREFIPFESVVVSSELAEDSSWLYNTQVIETITGGPEYQIWTEGVTTPTQFVERGTIEFTIPNDAPNILYYVSKDNINTGGFFKIYDITESSSIDVENEVIGKKTYTLSDGTELSNGMKIYFQGRVTPEKYDNSYWYVEGVGSGIKLINEKDLELPADFTANEEIEFDAEGFDSQGFDVNNNYPRNKDYLVINRSSKDRNPWSRYNRWFHKDVIETSANINNLSVEIDQTARASRPIIEFEADLQLWNFGKQAKQNVDVVDTFTQDVFSTIEGSLGYNVDGVQLIEGLRVLFTADSDSRVNGRIYRVSFLTHLGTKRITLLPEPDSDPIEGETVIVLTGNNNKGKMFYYQNGSWNVGQSKTSVNQSPLFDAFDASGTSYGDSAAYPGSSFRGTKVFSYRQGTTLDTELGFNISYRNIANIGDIVFDFNFHSDVFEYQDLANVKSINISNGYLRTNRDGIQFSHINGWKKAVENSYQSVIRQYDVANSTNFFEIDVYKDSGLLTDLDVSVHVNNKKQGVLDYEIFRQDKKAYVRFYDNLSVGDVLIIKTRSSAAKTDFGFYEFPTNLENNPNNVNVEDFTLGEIVEHARSISNSVNGFIGETPGTGNLRDLGSVTEYGKKIIQHSAPLAPIIFHTNSKDFNIIQAIRFAKTEYSKFKRNFIRVATDYGYDGETRLHLDLIMKDLCKDKPTHSSFYFSDMVPASGEFIFEQEVLDDSIIEYPLIFNFDLNTLSEKAVLVYLNEQQLLYRKDYEFFNENFVRILTPIQSGDNLKIVQYEKTNACFVPPTPTKLGIYPLYEPEIYVDDTYRTPTKVIQGHDGSLTIGFNDFRDDLLLEFEKRIYNNIKVRYDKDFFNIHDFIQGRYRESDITINELDDTIRQEFLNWSKLVNEDYTKHYFFDRNDQFTYNYKSFSDSENNVLKGFWRGIYKHAFDTDRPHTHPWEMLGFSMKPLWWESVYGPAPYTRDNLVLWRDISRGVIREPGTKEIVQENYIRPNILQHIPVNEVGELLSPLASDYVKDYVSVFAEREFDFGDHSPIESAWRRHSEYPFALITALFLLRPAKIFSTCFDRANQYRDDTGQIIYNTENGISRINFKNLKLPNTVNDTERTFTSGLVNYVIDFITDKSLDLVEDYKQQLNDLSVNLSVKLAGFTTKEKFKFILDSRTPLNQGNVFIPEENYNIFLNTSAPVFTINYSGVIVEKQPSGFIIRGYNQQVPEFKYYEVQTAVSDPVITVGGISEEFAEWTPNKYYGRGQVVRYDQNYFRTTTSHDSLSSFDEKFFVKLPTLPVVGGREIIIRSRYYDRIKTLSYGTELTEIQDVIDFLLGYGRYLESQGFVFDYYNPELKTITDWKTSAKEFAFWTTQNWAAGTVISLSPAAEQLIFKREYSVVDNIYDNFYEYSIFKQDGAVLEPSFTNVVRKKNEYSLKPVETADGIYHAELNLVQKEHVAILDNISIFGDVIYDQAQGYRQERIKILGYRTAGWQGDLDVPSFLYDAAEVSEWSSWKDYSLGETVKYKEFYYSAKSNVPGSENFNFSDWYRLDRKPESKLIPNWEYRAEQFLDFYDLDSDNFDTDQQKMAQHLIGYQPRQYLENIINDPVSQYKFYQGMIQEKGTQNSFDKLFNVLSSADKDSLEFYEEWAIRLGQYGSTDTFEEIEYKLDETKFLIDPQPIELVRNIDPNLNDFVYRVRPNEVYIAPTNYNHEIFPVKIAETQYIKTAGYVNFEDIDYTIESKDALADFNILTLKQGDYFWVTDAQEKQWDVLRFTLYSRKVRNVELLDNIRITLLDNLDPDLAVGDYVGINNTLDKIEGIVKILATGFNWFEIAAPDDITDDEITEINGNKNINIFKFSSNRLSKFDDLNQLAIPEFLSGETVWTDGEDNDWAVWQYNSSFDKIDFTQPERSLFSNNIQIDHQEQTIAVTGDNRVFYYSRPEKNFDWSFVAELSPQDKLITDIDEGYADTNDSFGDSLAFSPTGTFLFIGAPRYDTIQSGYVAQYEKDQNNVFLLKRIIDIKDELSPLQGGEGFGKFIACNESGLFVVGEGSIDNNVAPFIVYYRNINSTGASLTVTDLKYLNVGTEIIDFSLSSNNIMVVTTTDNKVHILKLVNNEIIESVENPTIQVSDIDPEILVPKFIDKNYQYLGDWGLAGATKKTYNADEVYTYSDNLYVCLETHVSTVEVPFLPSSSPNHWKSINWNSSTIYSENDRVIYNNKIYENNIISLPARDIQVSRKYQISSLKDDGSTVLDESTIFTTFGASSNEIGTIFVATRTGEFDDGESRVIEVNENKVPGVSILWKEIDYDFGRSVTINKDGSSIAIGLPYYTDTQIQQGSVAIFDLQDNTYVSTDLVTSYAAQESEQFGSRVRFNLAGSKLVVYGSGGHQMLDTTFDENQTTMDLGATKITDIEKFVGSVKIYDRYENRFLFSDQLIEENILGSRFADRFVVVNNIYLNDPISSSGTIHEFRQTSNSWTMIRSASPTVDIEKIKSIFLYNTVSNQIVDYLDFVDPIHGKILGIAEQELSYKTYYDPAVYNVGIELVVVDLLNPWISENVGKLWWDLSQAKFADPSQGTVVYKTNTWNTLAEGSSIDVYEWVESAYSPSEWDAIADTEVGLVENISGQSKYGDTVYTVKRKFDSVSETFRNIYYFWVKNKTIVPNIENRKISANEVAGLISDPKSKGIRFITLLDKNQFALFNCNNLIKNKDIAINFRYWVNEDRENNIHNHYQLMAEGDVNKPLNKYIEQKWFDSLIGIDINGNEVPDKNLPAKLKTGVLNRPRQSMFVNRIEALKQFVERTNSILIDRVLVDDFDLSPLNSREEEPSEISGKYDIAIQSFSELRFVGVTNIRQASLSLEITNGRISRVIILNPGRGYLIAPEIKISGEGSGARLKAVLNDDGEITSVTIERAGSGYLPTGTTASVRGFTVLVLTDETANGRWALYNYSQSQSNWFRSRVQTFDTTKYWTYADWYAEGFTEFSTISYVVDYSYQVLLLNMSAGDTVRIKNQSGTGWLMLEKTNNIRSNSLTDGYRIVGRQNGTIQLNDNLYRYNQSNVGFDGPTFDADFYDDQPTEELRIILNCLRDNILVDDLAIEYNKLFFSSLRYVFSEQLFVDWAFKTSMVRSKHNLGQLKQKINYQNDSLPSYEDYIREVKPYRSKIREFVSSYERLEQTRTVVSDFDLPARYDLETDSLKAFSVRNRNGVIEYDSEDILTEPYSDWFYNVGFEIKEITVADPGSGYRTAPTIEILGASSIPASATAYITNGRVTKIVIDNPGAGYLETPQINLLGSVIDGTEARAVATLGNSLVRTAEIEVKFDRTTANYVTSDITVSQQFTGSGSRSLFRLKWPIDIRKDRTTVTIDGQELLSSEYTVYNNLDTVSSYERYIGYLELEEPAPNLSNIIINYRKNADILNAPDRINFHYEPDPGQLGKDLPQLMEGVDYGGAVVTGITFGIAAGWDVLPWFTQGWDSIDENFTDYLVISDNSTRTFTLPYTPEEGELINVYLNGVRIDDPNYDARTTAQLEVNSAQTAYDILVTTRDNLAVQLDNATAAVSAADDALTAKQLELEAKEVEYAATPPSDPNFPTLEAEVNALRAEVSALTIELDELVDTRLSILSSYNTAISNASAALINLNQKLATLNATPAIANENAVMNTFVGDGSTAIVELPSTAPFLGDMTPNTINDQIIFRKSTSDGSFLPQSTTGLSYDTAIEGGDLAYSTAKGIDPDEINLDGDGLVTPDTSFAPEEVVPGQIVDSVNITVYNKVDDGAPVIVTRFYVVSDASQTDYSIGQQLFDDQAVFVLLNGLFLTHDIDYFVDTAEQTVSINVDLSVNDEITLLSMSANSLNILDLQYFEGDGTTTEFITPARWDDEITIIVTVDGKETSFEFFRTDDSYDRPFNIGFRLPNPPAVGSIVSYIVVNSVVNTFSRVQRQTIIYDGSTMIYPLTNLPFNVKPSDNNVIVEVNGVVLRPRDTVNFEARGSSRSFTVDPSQYVFNSIDPSQIRVYVRGELKVISRDFTWTSATNTLTLKPLVANEGDKIALTIFTAGVPDYEIDEDSNTITFLESYDEGTEVTIITFSNHDILDIERTLYYTQTTSVLSPGSVEYHQFNNLLAGRIPLRNEVLGSEYVWITVNRRLLSPLIDYIVESNRRYVTLNPSIVLDDDSYIEVITFSAQVTRPAFAYTIFKDMMNRVIYKRIDDEISTVLTQPLNYYDTSIVVENAAGLDEPYIIKNVPGIVFIDGERIEYMRKQGNVLSQLRRGTLGTGIKDVYPTGTLVRDQSARQTVPYRDELLENVLIAGGFDQGEIYYNNSPGVTVTGIKYNFNNTTAFPVRVPGVFEQVCTVTGTGFRSDVQVFVGDPTVYNTFTVTEINTANELIVSSIDRLYTGKTVTFSGSVFGGIEADTTYYVITASQDESSGEYIVTLSETPVAEGGSAFPVALTAATGSMTGSHLRAQLKTTYISPTQLTFDVETESIGAYDLIIYNPDFFVDGARIRATSHVAKGLIKYVQILIPWAPLPNPRTATGWYKETQIIPVTEIQPGRGYIIDTVGTTNFLSIGASANANAIEFIATGAGIGTGTVIDFPSIPYEYWESLDTDIFVAGRRLRKTPLTVWQENLGPDSPTGDRDFEAEFAVNKNIGAYVRLTEPPPKGSKVIVQKNLGKSWVQLIDISATAMVRGREYIIKDASTVNFTLLGANSNDIGTRFTATGPATSGNAIVTSFSSEKLSDADTKQANFIRAKYANLPR